MIVKYNIGCNYGGQVSVDSVDEIKFIPYSVGVLIYNISDGENHMSLDLTFGELKRLDELIQEMKRDDFVKKMME